MAHLIIWLVILAIGGLSKVATKKPRDPDEILTPRHKPRPRGGNDESEEARMRRFMEAVGLPPGSTPPPQTRRTPATTTTSTAAPLPRIQPPSPAGSWPIPASRLRRASGTGPVPPILLATPSRQLRGKPATPLVPSTFTPFPEAAPSPISEIVAAPPLQTSLESTTSNLAASASLTRRAPAPAQPSAPTPASALLSRLRNPTAIREAIILREILGPPKAFQPL